MSDASEPDAGVTAANARDVRFPCKSCGAPTRWDPDADALVCEHCDARVDVPRASGAIVERPLEAAGDALRGLGVSMRTATCRSCGARVSFVVLPNVVQTICRLEVPECLSAVLRAELV